MLLSRNTLAALLLSISLPALAQQAPAFRIAGEVIHHLSNRPVRGARVSVAPDQHRDRPIDCISGENGEFSFSGLPAGKYSLSVTDHGETQIYRQNGTYSTAIAVGSGLDSEHIIFSLTSLASISGTVIDDASDPVRGAMIYLFGQSVENGLRQISSKGTTSTNTDGTFRFAHLAPGTYYIAASGRPWYAQNDLPLGLNPHTGLVPPPPPPPELDVAYPMTYYANTTNPDAAAPLNLEEGAHADIHINLQPVPALHITLDGIQKSPEQQIQASVQQRGPGGTLIALPSFVINSVLTGIAPGNYILSSSLVGAKQPIEIGSQAVSLSADTTVNINEATRTSIRGKVIVDGAIPPQLSILLEETSNDNRIFNSVNPDGSFAISGTLVSGTYDLYLANTTELYMQTVTVKGGEYSKGQLNVSTGQQIEMTIVAGRGLTQVNGVVLNNKKPVPGAMVLLIPQDFSHGTYIPRDQSDSDGTFTLGAVAPGRYTLIAIDDGNNLEYANPQVIAPYLQAGRVIDAPLTEGARVEIEVQPRAIAKSVPHNRALR